MENKNIVIDGRIIDFGEPIIINREGYTMYCFGTIKKGLFPTWHEIVKDAYLERTKTKQIENECKSCDT